MFEHRSLKDEALIQQVARDCAEAELLEMARHGTHACKRVAELIPCRGRVPHHGTFKNA
jgi:hypothetical protein